MLRPMFSDTSEAEVDRAASELTGEPAPPATQRAAVPVPEPEPETVLIPVLRERASRMPRIDENIYAAYATMPLPTFREVGGPLRVYRDMAADATISLPIFREVGWPLPVYRDIPGLAPRYPAPAEATNRDRGRRHRTRSSDLDVPMGSTSQPSGPHDDLGREDSRALARRRQGPGHDA